MKRINRVLAIALVAYLLAGGVAVVALTQASRADDSARHTALVARRLAVKTKNLAETLAENTAVRAAGNCKSSTDIRQLMSDIDGLLNLAASSDLATQKVHRRILTFTATNPNCTHLLPEGTP